MNSASGDTHHRYGRSQALSQVRTGFMIGGTILVETVFAYPGVGRLLFDAVMYRDYPLLQGAFLIITLVIIAANFVADMVYVQLDPRLRHD